MGKWKSLKKYKKEFPNEPELARQLWLEQIRHRRQRTLGIIKTLSGVGLLMKLLGK